MSWLRILVVGLLAIVFGVLCDLLAAVIQGTVGQFTPLQAVAIFAGAIAVSTVGFFVERWPSRTKLLKKLRYHREQRYQLKKLGKSGQPWTFRHESAWRSHQDAIEQIRRKLQDKGEDVPFDPIDYESSPGARTGCPLGCIGQAKHTVVLLVFPIALVFAFYLSPVAHHCYLNYVATPTPTSILPQKTPTHRIFLPLVVPGAITSTPMPTVTFTATSQPTNTPTATFTPSPTPTYTPTPTPTNTSTPTLTPTLTPTPMPTPSLLPAPVPVEPEDGTEYCPDEVVWLMWQWDAGPLGPNEFYGIKVWIEGSDPSFWDRHWEQDPTKTQFEVRLWPDERPDVSPRKKYFQGPGRYFWNVVVLRDTEQDVQDEYGFWENIGEDISSVSETWSFIVLTNDEPACAPRLP